MGRRPAPPAAEPDQPVYIETGQGYTSAPINTHPDDYYVRVPIAPTFDRAWQGEQKQNAIANLAMGSVWAGMNPLGYAGGADDVYQPYAGNPMQHLGASNPTINKNVAAGGWVGPMTPGIGNPTASSTPYGKQPGLLSSIIRRLFG